MLIIAQSGKNREESIYYRLKSQILALFQRKSSEVAIIYCLDHVGNCLKQIFSSEYIIDQKERMQI